MICGENSYLGVFKSEYRTTHDLPRRKYAIRQKYQIYYCEILTTALIGSPLYIGQSEQLLESHKQSQG